MRKMTKTAAVLAAMSAMTVASASMAFAANYTYTAAKNDANVDAGELIGEWGGSDKEGWTFTVNGKKLDDTWAMIDGAWYYFDDDKMAQEELLFIDGKSYYFHEDGRMMADGWLKLSSDSDAYSTVDINDELLKGNFAVEDNYAYTYDDHIWLYFDKTGVAKETEWFQADSGLWYYFDGNVMVMNTYNYVIEPKNHDDAGTDDKSIYGFDKNGAMLTGWNATEKKATYNGPTEDEKGRTWFYYNPKGGKMQTKGWKQIDGDWYLFADKGDNTVVAASGSCYADPYAAIMNSYVTSYNYRATSGGKEEYFYLDAKGKMVTGVTKLPKEINFITFYNDRKDIIDSVYDFTTNSGKPEINFGSKGAAKEDIVGDRFYTLGKTKIVELSDNAKYTAKVLDFKAEAVTGTSAVTSAGAKVVLATRGSHDVYGYLVKKAFIEIDDELYLADDEGEFVTYKAVEIETGKFIVFNRYGEAYRGYEDEHKSVPSSNGTYWSTDETYDIAGVTVTVFKKNKN